MLQQPFTDCFIQAPNGHSAIGSCGAEERLALKESIVWLLGEMKEVADTQDALVVERETEQSSETSLPFTINVLPVKISTYIIK